MIYINCPLKQDFIIELLEGHTEGDIHFKFVSKAGIKMQFEVDSPDLDGAVALAKSLIKATEVGSVLYFQVTK